MKCISKVYEDEERTIFKQLNSKMIMEEVAWEITQKSGGAEHLNLKIATKGRRKQHTRGYVWFWVGEMHQEAITQYQLFVLILQVTHAHTV